MPHPRIKRALISVYDKTGVVEFAKALVEEFGIEIISTGGTAKLLKEAGLPVTLVEEVTGFPEMLDGRVKTLHPKIHAAILADRDNPEHMRQLKAQGIKPIDMVVVNLYPFEETISKPDCTFEDAIEMIDIGGPCLLRAAAKNHRHVFVFSMHRYDFVLETLRGDVGADTRDRRFVATVEAFLDTARYETCIASWFSSSEVQDDVLQARFLEFTGWGPIRYGENPHQSAELLQVYEHSNSLDLTVADTPWSDQRDLSFNNYVDAAAALELCAELTRECCTGFQPVQQGPPRPVSQAIDDERHSRRNLPHIQTPGKTYFVTFRLKQRAQLDPHERDIVLDACHFWDGRKVHLHAAVVMPDHVHVLFTPLEVSPGQWVSLGEILHSIKRHTAGEINKRRESSGPLWMDESFDRIMRNEQEFRETADYIANNPIKQGLAEKDSYAWWWDEELHRLETGATHLETGATHLETGATHLETGAKPLETAAKPLETAATHRARKAGDGSKPLYTCVFVKHSNACGVGIADDADESYRRAYLGDPNAAMGGILACSFDVTPSFAETVMNTYSELGKPAGTGGFFVEVWVAPAFDDEALKIIRSRKKWGERVRLLSVGEMSTAPHQSELDYRKITGGMLVQQRDLAGLNEDQWKVVTERKPTDNEMANLRLAWLICKHTKSNAITICKENMLIGNGAGQMSRVMSCRIATWLAKENGHEEKLRGAAASDAFFPFRDGPDLLMDAGVTAIIQPGGSKRDADTITACNERNVAMIFTGTRHFKH